MMYVHDAEPESLQDTEYSLFAFLSNRIANKRMIDVGAHRGSAFLPFVQQGWSVDAFEPIKENYEALRQKFDNYPGLRIHTYALSSAPGMRDMHLALNLDGSLHSFYHSLEVLPEDVFHKRGPVSSVEAKTIDQLVECGELPRSIGLLKIDTEGHDLHVLSGAKILEAEVVSVEYWCDDHALGTSPSPPSEMIEVMKSRGYKDFIAIVHNDLGTSFEFSSFGPPSSSWGNIVFFHTGKTDLFEECSRYCSLSKQPPAAEKSLLLIVSRILPKDPTMIVIGSCEDGFAAMFSGLYPRSRLHLLDPSDDSAAPLGTSFTSMDHVSVSPCSISHDVSGVTVDGSAQRSEVKSNVREAKVVRQDRDVTIDHYVSRTEQVGTVDLLKLDTKGYDLAALRGGFETIRKYRPLILSRMSFLPHTYQDGSLGKLLSWLEEQGYALAGIYNAHSVASGLLAFADALFVNCDLQESLFGNVRDGRFQCVDWMLLLDLNRNLQHVCDERMRVIESLNQVAEERLQLIKRLEQDAADRLHLINQLTVTTQERLNVIQTLDAEVQRLHREGV